MGSHDDNGHELLDPELYAESCHKCGIRLSVSLRRYSSIRPEPDFKVQFSKDPDERFKETYTYRTFDDHRTACNVSVVEWAVEKGFGEISE